MSKASTETFLEQVRSGKTETVKYLIYETILRTPGITLKELELGLSLPHQTASARLSDLMDLGVVEITGQRCAKESIFYSELTVVTDEKRINDNILDRNEKRFQKALKSLLSFDNHLEPELKEQLAKHLKVKL